ncbi:transcription termination factor NusA [Helicobacter macacae]|uniref:Transcription termination/antitermination protein NusA n=1 Tax=Helicobacter macacae MIT 99-5501 TaxID=1357400 RepID=V8C995_9HELI|nr:transcription termination factor NusA [Helicobacter macacae]ETD23963.1 transcription termination factor NusA [Helicobacter macacae MIT 99-5501]
MEKILDIIELLAHERGLEPAAVSQVVKETIIKTAKKQFGEELNYIIEEDEKERDFRLIHAVIVCADDDERASKDSQNFIRISEAKKSAPDISLNDEIHYEISLENMSRNAVNSLFSDLGYNIQKTIDNQLYTTLKAMQGKIVSGQVIAIDDAQNTHIEIKESASEVRAILPLKNRIKGEKFKINDTVSAILRSVKFQKDGVRLEISRTTPRMLEALLENEVPEIKDGEVLIHKSARIPGERAKVALYTANPRIDPIGATVGTKGVRINAVSRELNGENIDCIEYSEVAEMFIARALSPAQILGVKIEKAQETQSESQNEAQESSDSRQNSKNDKKSPKAKVLIATDQKSKAIGRSGINIRLACMLTGYDIELEEVGKEAPKEATQEELQESTQASELIDSADLTKEELESSLESSAQDTKPKEQAKESQASDSSESSDSQKVGKDALESLFKQ